MAKKRNEKPPVNTIEPSRCVRSGCGSTERGPYHGVVVQEVKGLDGNGKPYDRIVRRRTQCTKCGQVRIDRTYESGPGGSSLDEHNQVVC